MSLQEYTCPVEGCDYTGPKTSVAGHYGGKKADSGHTGSYQDCLTLLEQENTSEQASEQEQATEQAQEQVDTGSSSPSDSEQASGGGSNPVHETPPADTSQQASADGGNETAPACPECGEEPGMPASELEAGAVYVCDGCGTHLRWNP